LTEGTIHIGTGAHIQLLLAAPLVQRLRTRAPRIKVRFQSVNGNFDPEDFNAERMDIAVGLFHDVAPSLHHCKVLRDQRVCVVSADHPMAHRKRLSLDDLRRLKWVAVADIDGSEPPFERTLKPLHRQIVFSAYLSGVGIATEVLMHSEYARTMPACLALQHQRHFPLAVLEMPAPMRDMAFSMVWAKRQHTSALHA
jgi:DNA-binding transcriptional LysR family regulator